MAKKLTTKSHLVDVDGNLVAPGTEIEESRLGDAATVKRYRENEAIEESVIVTGEVDDKQQVRAAQTAVKDAKSSK